MEDKSFKGALFGGFRRRDVIEYIEKSANAANGRIAELESSENALAQENDALRGDLASVTGARDRLSEALHENFDKQESLSAALSAANEKLETLRAQLEALTAERDALKSEAETLRPQAEEFRAVKENLTALELAAHQRADAYESETRSRADAYERETRERADTYEAETRARVSELLNGCRSQCELVLTTLGETCANVTSELQKSTETVSRLPAAFHTLRHDLGELGNE